MNLQVEQVAFGIGQTQILQGIIDDIYVSLPLM